jgi:WD40 repeat protein
VLHRYKEKDNQVNAVDINSDGTKFATGGLDTLIRLYDLGKRTTPTIMEGN